MVFSIIVPVYKVEQYIIRCLESINQQVFSDYELIIVDDCSPDSSILLAQEFLVNTSLDWKIIHHDENRGLSAARNSGIRIAKGDWILFVDSDDELSHNALESFQIFLSNNVDIIVGNYETHYADRVETSIRYSSHKVFESNKNILKAYSVGDIPVMAWNKLIKRDFLYSNNLFFKEGIYNEDELWTLAMLNKASKVILTGEVSYHYMVRQGSIMTRDEYKTIDSSIRIYKELSSFIKINKIKYLNTWLKRFRFRIIKRIYSSSLLNEDKKRLYERFSLVIPYRFASIVMCGYFWLKK